MTFRIASVDDARAIAEFQTTCWREAYLGLVPQDYLDSVGAATRQRRWTARIFERQRTVLIAESDGAIVGVASHGLRDEALELMSLYVGAECRGSGLAQQLLDGAIGDEPAQLWVFEGNDRAIGFYVRNGFAADGERMIDPDTGLVCIRLSRNETSSTCFG